LSEFSNPGLLWLGRGVFCLGSGPSLSSISTREWNYINKLQTFNGFKVLGINSSFKFCREMGVEADALFFTDESWFHANEKEIRDFKGLKFTVSRRAKNSYPEGLMRIENVHQPEFFVGSPPMKDGRSSGHRAISLSIMLGAKIISLLGYDMRVVRIETESGIKLRSHYHNEYQNTESEKAYSQEFVRGFDGWQEASLKVGCQIINCTPNSAVTEFASMPLSEFLKLSVK
jgi:hypothetical protein